MKRMTIKALLLILGGATLAGFAATIFMLSYQSHRITATFDHILNVEEALLGQLQEMYAQGLQTEQATRNVVLNPGDGKAKENYAAADAKFKKALADASRLAKGPLAESLVRLAPLWEEAGALKR